MHYILGLPMFLHFVQSACPVTDTTPDWLVPKATFIASTGKYSRYCQDLEEIPKDIPRNTTEVRIYGNPLQIIRNTDFQHLSGCTMLAVAWINM